MDEPTFDRSDESLLYAFSELLGRLNISTDMATLRDALTGQDLNFESLTEGENVHIVEKGEYGSWPTSSNAIIKFQFQDMDEPYIELEDGSRDANIIDHYCLVADYEQKTIIDSANGAVREGAQYGHPVSWAMFEAGSAAKAPEPKMDKERSYRVLNGGESGWQIARKLGVSGSELKEHNADDVDDFSNIPEGTILHLPTRIQPGPKDPITEFEFLRRPLDMHVSKPGGARKYTFGNAKSAITETGPTNRENKNINIFALAHVPVGDDIVTYYMESGDVDSSRKKIKWTVGFAKDDIADGHVDPNKVELPPVQEIIAQKLDEAAERKKQLDTDQLAKKSAAAERLAMIEDVNAQDNPPSRRQGSDSLPLEDPDYNAEWWKHTYAPLNDQQKPEVFIFNEDIVVRDLEGKCKNKLIQRLAGVRVAGTFTGPDSQVYYLPQDAMDLKAWYGIPLDAVMSEAELYNTNLPLAERASMRHGRLSKIERFVTVPLAKATAKSPWLRRYADKAKQNKE